MAIIKCKMCGGELNLTEGATIAQCEYCGSRQTIPVADNEKKLLLFERAEFLRRSCEFDKAAGVYESIVADYRQEAEAYWGLVLCKYGIEYVDDPVNGKKVPTCHRSSFDSVLKDSNFQLAQEYADVVARKVCREEAKLIEDIRKGILEVSAKEAPYDIFICYKETDFDGKRTLDSVLAQDIYDALTAKGYRVFFSRISLEDKLGQEYEPYIFAALNSAKIMLVVGTEYEFFNAVWVKNEWSRFLKLMTQDKDKHLIPCYKGIDAYDMPEEFARLQAQDLDKMGAIQDILRGVDKLLCNTKESVVVSVAAQDSVAPLLKRASMFLEDGQWAQADDFCEKVLNMDPECAKAYLIKLLAELKLSSEEQLASCDQLFTNRDSYRKALRFSDETEKAKLVSAAQKGQYAFGCRLMKSANNEMSYRSAAEAFGDIPGYLDADSLKESCLEQAELARKKKVYAQALSAMNLQTIQGYEQAIEKFKSISDWNDSETKLALCKEKLRKIHALEEEKKQEALRREALLRQERAERAQKLKAYAIVAGVFAVFIFVIYLTTGVIIPGVKYAQAKAAIEEKDYRKAAVLFGELGDYEDAFRKSKTCWEQVVKHQTFDIRNDRIAAVLGDGTVTTEGRLNASDERIEKWDNIVSLAYKGYQLTALQKDGTVLTSKEDSSIGKWKNIVAIRDSGSRTVGLQMDGTLVDENGSTFSGTNGVVTFDCYRSDVAAVRYDGTVKVIGGNYPDVSQWKDIVDISMTESCLAGLKKDGTVVLSSPLFDVSAWTDIVQIKVCESHIVGLKSDGTVLSAGSNTFGECNTAQWSDIVAIDTDEHQTVGLKSNGTFVGAGHKLVQADEVAEWTNVEKLAAGSSLSAGLKKDGSLVASGSASISSNFQMPALSEIQEIYCIDGSWGDSIAILKRDGTVVDDSNQPIVTDAQAICFKYFSLQAVLRKDGTVVFKDGTQNKVLEYYYGKDDVAIEVSGWEHIIQVDTGDDYIAGLQNDGTVIAAGAIDELDGCYAWSGIVEISASKEHIVGLKNNGTVVACGNNSYGKCDVDTWKNITAIATGERFTVGLKKDGTVVYAGHDSDLDALDSWTDIVSICAGNTYVLGLKSDGTVVSAGDAYTAHLDISQLSDVKIP